MLLSPRAEAALFAVLCTGRPSMLDLFQIQQLQVQLQKRANVRQVLNEQSARTKEFQS